jgi:hypothetical protein
MWVFDIREQVSDLGTGEKIEIRKFVPRFGGFRCENLIKRMLKMRLKYKMANIRPNHEENLFFRQFLSHPTISDLCKNSTLAYFMLGSL